jgi:hypothetical protein
VPATTYWPHIGASGRRFSTAPWKTVHGTPSWTLPRPGRPIWPITFFTSPTLLARPQTGHRAGGRHEAEEAHTPRSRCGTRHRRCCPALARVDRRRISEDACDARWCSRIELRITKRCTLSKRGRARRGGLDNPSGGGHLERQARRGLRRFRTEPYECGPREHKSARGERWETRTTRGAPSGTNACIKWYRKMQGAIRRARYGKEIIRLERYQGHAYNNRNVYNYLQPHFALTCVKRHASLYGSNMDVIDPDAKVPGGHPPRCSRDFPVRRSSTCAPVFSVA